MTVALLVMLGVTAASGMGLLAVEDGRGPLAGIIAAAPQDRGVSYGADRGREGRKHGEDREHGEGRDGGKAGDLWEEVHEIAANLTLALIVLHIAGVALASVMHRENLVRAMVTGRKRA